ncbi:MAG: peptidylprolyl isomerase [bacterium]|nr:peptidylprolyl isomerase [bacterium]
MKKNILKFTLGFLAILVLGLAVFFFLQYFTKTENTAPAEKVAQVPSAGPLKQNMYLITLKTNFGEIQFETYDTDAPKAASNFITLAQKGFYNGLTFHRVIKGFMIQGGDPLGNGTGGPGYTFEDELNPAAPSYQEGYKKGVVAMANAGPNTNGSQFFIMLEDTPLPRNYTIFGKVAKGQEVVDAIGQVPTGFNDRPKTAVVIQSVLVEQN